jgi:hypothetical protein
MSETWQRPPGARRTRRGERTLYFVVWFCVLFGVWFVLVDSLAHPEVAAAPVAAALGAGVAVAVRYNGGARFRARLGWLREARGVPLAVLRDSALLGGVLFRRVVLRQRPQGAFRRVRLGRGGDDARAAAWRAFVTIATPFFTSADARTAPLSERKSGLMPPP